MLSYAKIVLLCVTASVIYGVIHDQFTARICPEYFTIGHPPVFETDDPTLLGLGWGFRATWWAGAAVGLMLGVAARAGGRRRISPRELIKPVLVLISVMAASAAVFGALGYLGAQRGLIGLEGTTLGEAIPPARHSAFLADAFAHTASYWVGFIGGAVLCWMTWRRRKTGSSRLKAVG